MQLGHTKEHIPFLNITVVETQLYTSLFIPWTSTELLWRKYWAEARGNKGSEQLSLYTMTEHSAHQYTDHMKNMDLLCKHYYRWTRTHAFFLYHRKWGLKIRLYFFEKAKGMDSEYMMTNMHKN